MSTTTEHTIIEIRPPAGEYVRDDGYVYCLSHGGIHDNTTDPYDYGEPDCDRTDHRLVYWRARTGDCP